MDHVRIKKINIGITIGMTSYEESMWINGIKLNAIYLLRTLQRSPNKYNVYLINTNPNFKVDDPEMKLPWDREKYPIYQYNLEIVEKTDLLIMLGTSFDQNGVDQFKQHKGALEKKVIGYRCGNNYVIDMERSIFKSGEDAPKSAWSGNLDDVWFVPQQEKHNKYLYDVMESVNSKPVPFVWSPEFLDEFVYNISSTKPKRVRGAAKNTYSKREKKRISCFEPNMNVLKFALIPTLAVEEAYNKDPEKIDIYAICMGSNLGTNANFVSTAARLNITKNKILKVDSRWPMPYYLLKNTDIVVSHQWDNPLNYAYLDALYMGYPLVHNAYMVQDAGYYYHEFNIKQAGDALLQAINDHDDNIKEYNQRSNKVLNRYLPESNYDIVLLYDRLIDNLWNPVEYRPEDYVYDWQTNLYKK